MLLYLGSALGEVFMCVITFGGSETAKIYQSFQMIGYSFGGAIISFLIFKGILSNYGSKFSPKPPKVTMENVDLQNVSDDIFNG
jgi:hypothetical protein